MHIRKAQGDDLVSRVDKWYQTVKETAAKTNGVVQGKTYTTYDQVYALSLEAMKQKYPDAEIFCMTLQESDHNNTTVEKLEKFNVVISGLAKYFGATVIDQQMDGITFDNCQAYSTDYRALHPNAIGHAKMAEYIVENMYNKMNSEK